MFCDKIIMVNIMKKYQLANYIYEHRIQLNMSQKELAAILGVTNKSVSKWETSAAIPRTNTLVKLAEIFNTSVDELFAEEESEDNSIDIITAGMLDDRVLERLNAEKNKTKAAYRISKKDAKLYLLILLSIFLIVFILSFALAFVDKDSVHFVTVEQGSILESREFSMLLAAFISGIYTGIVAFSRFLKRIPMVAAVIMVLFFPITVICIFSFGICFIIPISIQCIKVIREEK